MSSHFVFDRRERICIESVNIFHMNMKIFHDLIRTIKHCLANSNFEIERQESVTKQGKFVSKNWYDLKKLI